MGKQSKYLPLKCLDLYERNHTSGGVLSILTKQGLLPNELDEADFAGFVFGNDFLNAVYTGSYAAFNRHLLRPGMLEYMAGKLPLDAYQKPSFDAVRTELKDMLGIPVVYGLWSKHKQAYLVDADFFEALRRTESPAVPRDAFLRLPVPTLYIDFSACAGLEPIKGAFVHALESPYGGQAAVYMVTEEPMIFSYYTNFRYQDGGVEKMSTEAVPATKFMGFRIPEDGKGKPQPVTYQNDSRMDTIRAILQTLVFLSSKKPDIRESEATKRTYRAPSGQPKNRWSEIQMWDVGMRYGTAIRKAWTEMTRDARDAADKDSGTALTTAETANKAGVRKPMRPHLRRAHWQRYHVGEGRKEVRVNWVPPVFVNAKGETPVTIHLTGV